MGISQRLTKENVKEGLFQIKLRGILQLDYGLCNLIYQPFSRFKRFLLLQKKRTTVKNVVTFSLKKIVFETVYLRSK